MNDDILNLLRQRDKYRDDIKKIEDKIEQVNTELNNCSVNLDEELAFVTELLNSKLMRDVNPEKWKKNYVGIAGNIGYMIESENNDNAIVVGYKNFPICQVDLFPIYNTFNLDKNRLL